MITIVARFKCQEGKEDEGEKLLRDMVESVKANEPGVVAYLCHRSVQDPSEIFFYEIYENEEAQKAHGKTEHMQNMNANFAKVFAPPVKVEKMDRLAGFIRKGTE